MAKKLIQIVKLQIPSGKANPAPPIGPALGQHGLNIQDFCKQFNDRSKDQPNTILPVAINVYDDRTFDFIIKTPPAAELIKKMIGLESGSKMSHKEKVGNITKAQIREIAERKMVDLNANDVEAAMKIISGTARSMGVVVVD